MRSSAESTNAIGTMDTGRSTGQTCTPAIVTGDSGAHHPYVEPSLIPKTRSNIPDEMHSAPGTSMRCRRAGRGGSRMKRIAPTMADGAMITLTTNAQRHE